MSTERLKAKLSFEMRNFFSSSSSQVQRGSAFGHDLTVLSPVPAASSLSKARALVSDENLRPAALPSTLAKPSVAKRKARVLEYLFDLFREVAPGLKSRSEISKRKLVLEKKNTQRPISNGSRNILDSYTVENDGLKQTQLNTALLDTCKNGEAISKVECLLDRGADITSSNEKGETPLLLACQSRKLDLVEYLLKRAQLVNQLEAAQNSFNAVFNPSTAFFLVKEKLLAADHSGLCPLQVAVYGNDLKMVILLVNFGASVDRSAEDRQSPFALACTDGSLEMVKLLFKKVANVNQVDHQGQLPLIRAILAERLDVACFLHANGADIYQKDSNGLSALDIILSMPFDKQVLFRPLLQELKNRALLKACEAKNNEEIQVLIESGADVNACDENGKTPLIIAILAENYHAIELLLNGGANLNFITEKIYSPLWYAADAYNIEMIKFLIAKGADIKLKIRIGANSSVEQYMRGIMHIPESKSIREAFAAFLKELENQQETALLTACKEQRLDDVKTLIEAGANVDYCDGNQMTALKIAATTGQLELIMLLIQQGLRMSRYGIKSLPPLWTLDLQIVKLLIENGLVVDELLEATDRVPVSDWGVMLNDVQTNGSADFLEKVLRNQIRLHEKDVTGKTGIESLESLPEPQKSSLAPLIEISVLIQQKRNWALMKACTYGQLTKAEMLLQAGADANSTDQINATALYRAVSKNNIKMAKLLFKYGADVNLITESTISPLCQALYQDNLEMIMLLLERGADLTLPSQKGGASLARWVEMHSSRVFHVFSMINLMKINVDFLQACKNGKLDEVVKLFDNGADVNYAAHSGETPLINAMQSGHFAVAERLIDYGADVNYSCSKCYPPIYHAISDENSNAIEFLKNHGADPFENDNRNHLTTVQSVMELSHALRKNTLPFLESAGVDLAEAKEISRRGRLAHIFGFGGSSSIRSKSFSLEGSSVATRELLVKLVYEFLEIPDHPLFKQVPEIKPFLKTAFNTVASNQNLSAEAIESIILKASEPVILPVLTEGTSSFFHLVSVLFYKNYVVKCNRGYGSTNTPALRIYKREGEDSLRFVLKKLRNINDMNIEYFNEGVDSDLNLIPLGTISQKKQKVGNCNWLSLRSQVRGAVYVWCLAQEYSSVLAEKLSWDFDREFAAFSQKRMSQKYLSKLNPDLKEAAYLDKLKAGLARKKQKAARDGADPSGFEKIEKLLS